MTVVQLPSWLPGKTPKESHLLKRDLTESKIYSAFWKLCSSLSSPTSSTPLIINQANLARSRQHDNLISNK